MASSSSYSAIAAAYPKQLTMPSRETPSETSSTDSEMSNLHTIAAQLGMNMKELSIDQFKVEREKLEAMLTEECEEAGTTNAEKFFNDIMEETSTYIKWPRRLKIGAKTRKDPHVEIIGKYENVKRAKELVFSLLNSRGNRVTIKLNVSYRDHSFIIGKCGKSIKTIMDDTKTHIHFPDSNRFNKHEKSNQVSFTGPLEGVEKARARVRKSSPLVLQFELPVLSNDHKLPDVDSPLIREVCSACDVQVSYSHRSKLHAASVLVKGCESNSGNVKAATQRLIGLLCKGVSGPGPMEVTIQMDISPQYHFIVKGKENRNLKRIMEYSKTKILFPDLNDTNFSPLRRCQISITGTIDGVCEARDYIIGNLPVALMFEYPDKNIDLDEITHLNKTLDVFITVRSKSHQGSLCIVVKGIEKYVTDIYEARTKILQLNQTPVVAEVPSSYYFQYENKNTMQVQSLFQMYSNSPTLDYPTPGSSVVDSHLPYSPSENLTQMMNRMFLTPSPQPTTQQQQQQHQQQSSQQPTAQQSQPSSVKAGGSPNQTSDYADSTQSNSGYGAQGATPRSSISPRNASNNTSGYHSVSGSSNSLDHLNNYAACLRQQRFCGSIGSTTPPQPATAASSSLQPQPSALGHRSSTVEGFHQSPNFEIKRSFDHSPIFDLDLKKLDGLKAMEMMPRADQPRTPTSWWAGAGLSRSLVPKNTPAATTSPFSANNAPTPFNSPYNLGKTGGILDSTPTGLRHQLARHDTIQSLLTFLRLEHYISNFVSNEIDLDMLATLTEDDLQTLGITAFGPRKKLLMAINYLSTQQQQGAQLGGMLGSDPNMGLYHAQAAFQHPSSGSGGAGRPQSQLHQHHQHQPQQQQSHHHHQLQQQLQQHQQQLLLQHHQQQLQQKNNSDQAKEAHGMLPPAGYHDNTNNTKLLNQHLKMAGNGGVGCIGPPPGMPPKFSGSAAPGAERRTSNSS